MIKCPFCDYQSNILHKVTAHLLEKHRKRIDTDASPDGRLWSYFKSKAPHRYQP